MQSRKMGDSGFEELTVCDIMGDWGSYQWSLTLFATLYSALISMTVVVGPIWTPEMRHICASSNETIGLEYKFDGDQHQCFANVNSSIANSTQFGDECSSFIYDNAEHGTVLTNTFDLVCDRRWLRSFISSSALIGMLISSVTLGLLSDRFGRLRCIQVAFVISISATVGAILAHNYFLLNACIMLISYAQVGAANALCTLVMEATSPRFRFVPVFEYGFGWGLGMMVTPILHSLTLNYKHFLLFELAVQLIMLIWLRWGVFESIRWLISEGRINQAQIELRRACRFNRIQNGAELAQRIANVQMQQLRKASNVIDNKFAEMDNHNNLETATQELDLIRDAIRYSISLESPIEQMSANSRSAGEEEPSRVRLSLSPTLAIKSFSINPIDLQEQERQQNDQLAAEEIMKNLSGGSLSLTNRGLVHLALKYSNTLQKNEEGTCFLIQMFHRKLAKTTILLMSLSLMLETSYYGLIQANKLVGTDIQLNYISGALGEWLAAILYMLILWLFSRRIALIGPTLVGSCSCLGIALAYHLISAPQFANKSEPPIEANLTGFMDQVDSFILSDNITTLHDEQLSLDILSQNAALELKERISFWLMTLGKLSITVAIQVSATIQMESYPNNLRQTGSGAIVFVGRIGSILAPFLFNDYSVEKVMFKSTLLVVGLIGLIVSAMVPFFLRDNKGKDLCDRLNDIEET